MARSNFESLEVYRLAERVSDEVCPIVATWEPFARDTVGRQVVRAADAIEANIAEGSGRGSFQDHRRFVRTARGFLHETQHWLRRAYTRGLLAKGDVDFLKPLIDELAPRLNAYLRSIGRQPIEGDLRNP